MCLVSFKRRVSFQRETSALHCHHQHGTDRSECGCGTEDDVALKYTAMPLHLICPQTELPPLLGRSAGRARLSRHKAILVNKAVPCRSEETALVYVLLDRPDPITQLFLSLNNLLSLFGEVSLSLSARLAALPLLCLSLMPYFIQLSRI